MPSVVMVNAVCSGSHGRIMSDIGRVAQAAGFRTHIAFARGAANGADTVSYTHLTLPTT